MCTYTCMLSIHMVYNYVHVPLNEHLHNNSHIIIHVKMYTTLGHNKGGRVCSAGVQMCTCSEVSACMAVCV